MHYILHSSIWRHVQSCISCSHHWTLGDASSIWFQFFLRLLHCNTHSILSKEKSRTLLSKRDNFDLLNSYNKKPSANTLNQRASIVTWLSDFHHTTTVVALHESSQRVLDLACLGRPNLKGAVVNTFAADDVYIRHRLSCHSCQWRIYTSSTY